MLFKAAAAFALAAALTGTGPLAAFRAGPLSPGWQRVQDDLTAARPQARLTDQIHALFHSGVASGSVARRLAMDH